MALRPVFGNWQMKLRDRAIKQIISDCMLKCSSGAAMGVCGGRV